MPVTRRNCVVLDTSILPIRPTVADIKQFLDRELKLDMALVKSIQPHNVKHVVYMVMHSEEVASKIASDHHLKHHMECEGKRLTIPLPIYIDSSAVDVRLHDLPEEIENETIINYMQQYGETISIRCEVWKSYFPGLSNGVRVVRMKLTKPIPSYITIADEVTLTSYFSQQKTCRNCGSAAHPKLRCSEAGKKTTLQQINTHPPMQRAEPNPHRQQTLLADNQFPHLPPPETDKSKPKQISNNKKEPKRTLSTDTNTTSSQPSNKKTAPSNRSTSTESDSTSSSLITVSDGLPREPPARVRRVSYSHIDDPVRRQQYIDEDDRRRKELYEMGYRI